MIPILYGPTETAFSSFGIGQLSDAVSCTVREKLNGEYELELSLPASSRHLSEIMDRAIILAKPNPHDQPQPFRIYRDARPSSMLVTLYAQHISYDLDGIPVAPFTAGNAAAAVAAINNGALVQNSFSLSTSMSVSREMSVKVPTVARSLLGEQDQSLLRRYGGELKFDRFSVALLPRRGADRGFVIAYGKNLVDVKQERNIADLFTGVLPYFAENDATVWGDPQYAAGSWNYVRALPVDLSALFSETPTKAQLNAAGAQYVIDEKIGQPKVSITATYVPPGSLNLHSLEDMQLGDGVTVRFERLGIDTQSRMIGYTWDVLRERYTSVEIGDPQETAASAISDARRLTKGTIDSQRFGARSISGGAIRQNGISTSELGDNSVTVNKLGDNSVTVNKIVNGAVVTEKIKDGSVTGNKVLDQAITLAKLEEDIQILWADIVATNRLLAGKVGTAFLSATNVYATYLFVNNVRYALSTKYIYDIDGNSLGGVTALMPVFD